MHRGEPRARALRIGRARRAQTVPALLALALTACPSGDPPQQPAAAPSIVPVRGGTLILTIAGDLDALDPHLAASPASWAVARALHRGLYAYRDAPGARGTRPVPDLAVAMPIADEARRAATIRLQPGVRFARGAEVSAGDVVASLNRVTASTRGIGPALRAALASVVEEDELVVRVVARRSIDELLALLAHPQAAILDADVRPIGRIRAPAGAGPYTLVREEDARYVLRRRDDVPSDPVRPAYAQEIHVVIGGRARPDALALDGGPPDLQRPRAVPRARVARVATGCVRYLDTAGAGAVRARLARALRGLREIGTGPVASALVPPLLADEPAPAPAGRSVRDPVRFTLVTSTSPRDVAEVAEIRRVLPGARVVRVSPSLLYGRAAVPRGARVRTTCADVPRASSLLSGVADGAVPLWWPVEQVELGARIRGFTGSPVFPRGDPTAIWLAPV